MLNDNRMSDTLGQREKDGPQPAAGGRNPGRYGFAKSARANVPWSRAVFDAVPCGIVIIDPSNHTIVDINPTAAKMFGREAENIIGSVCHRFICPTEEGCCPITDLGQGLDNAERTMVSADGTTCPVIKTVVSVTMEGRDYLIETLVDITERKAAEERLLCTQFAVDRAMDASFWVGPDGRFVYVNEAARRSLGYTEEELLSMSVFDVDPRFPREKWNDRWEHARLAGSFTVETTHRTKSGVLFPVEISTNFMDFEGREFCCDYVRDLTERKSLESQLRQSQKMEAIGTLAGGNAHDFNNLLTLLIGYSTLLHMKMGESDPMRGYVDQILSASQKAADLTHGLLAFSRRQHITLFPLSLNELVRGIERVLQRLITEDILLTIDLCVEDVTIMADATQIDQIMFNLATNARDAMPGGGVLTIGTRRVYLPEEIAGTDGPRPAGAYAVISVSDTGTGMDEATLPKIFDPFFTTKEVGKGTGLGLSTVYGIVKQHDGHIDVTSEPGKGTTFTVHFPVASGLSRKGEDAPQEIPRGAETVLVAEDSVEVRRFLAEILRGHGYTVIEASNGKEAVSRFHRNRGIDLLILDSVMPEKNGRDVYNEVKKSAPHIRTLFTSGYTRDVVLDKGVGTGGFDFLAKPVSAGRLLRKVREILDRKV